MGQKQMKGEEQWEVGGGGVAGTGGRCRNREAGQGRGRVRQMMDRQTDGWMDGWTGRWKDKRMGRPIDRYSIRRTNG